MRRAWLVGLLVLSLIIFAAKTGAAETFGASTSSPSKVNLGWSERRVHSQLKSGAIAFGAGYTGAALIPILANVDGPSEHPSEKALALIPIAGPGIYWFAALDRLNERRAYEAAHPCQSTGSEWSCAFHDTAGIDTFFHAMIMAPYVILSTGAQVIGVVYLLQAAYHANDAAKEPPPKSSVSISPTPGGILLHGTF